LIGAERFFGGLQLGRRTDLFTGMANADWTLGSHTIGHHLAITRLKHMEWDFMPWEGHQLWNGK
jgi:hypothetical protein